MCHTYGLPARITLWPKVVAVDHKVARSGPSKLVISLPHKWNMLIILVLKLSSQPNAVLQEAMHMDLGQKTVLWYFPVPLKYFFQLSRRFPTKSSMLISISTKKYRLHFLHILLQIFPEQAVSFIECEQSSSFMLQKYSQTFITLTAPSSATKFSFGDQSAGCFVEPPLVKAKKENIPVFRLS